MSANVEISLEICSELFKLHIGLSLQQFQHFHVTFHSVLLTRLMFIKHVVKMSTEANKTRELSPVLILDRLYKF